MSYRSGPTDDPERAMERRPGRRGNRGWVPVAIIAGAIAALAGGWLLGVALMDGDRQTNATSPTPSASASESAEPSSGPSESASPTPTPTPATADIIGNLAIAEVTNDDGVEMRSAADESAQVMTMLAQGRRVFIIGDPTEADDQRWYRVATLPAGCPSTLGCEVIGFVPTPIEEGDQWVEELSVDCPTPPITDAALAVLHAFERLSCYGNNEIEIEGVVAHTGCCDADSGIDFTPAWLAPHLAQATFAASGIGFLPHPDADLDLPEDGSTVRATGHFEDSEAPTCRMSFDEGVSPQDPPTPALVVLRCRATFVWTDYEVIAAP
jgi:hypothetical protein